MKSSISTTQLIRQKKLLRRTKNHQSTHFNQIQQIKDKASILTNNNNNFIIDQPSIIDKLYKIRQSGFSNQNNYLNNIQKSQISKTLHSKKQKSFSKKNHYSSHSITSKFSQKQNFFGIQALAQNKKNYRVKYKEINKKLHQFLKKIQNVQNIQLPQISVYQQQILTLFLNDYINQSKKQCFDKGNLLQFIWKSLFTIINKMMNSIVQYSNKYQKHTLNQIIYNHTQYQKIIEQYKKRVEQKSKQLEQNQKFVKTLVHNMRFKKRQVKKLYNGIKYVHKNLCQTKENYQNLQEQHIDLLMENKFLSHDSAKQLLERKKNIVVQKVQMIKNKFNPKKIKKQIQQQLQKSLGVAQEKIQNDMKEKFCETFEAFQKKNSNQQINQSVFKVFVNNFDFQDILDGAQNSCKNVVIPIDLQQKQQQKQKNVGTQCSDLKWGNQNYSQTKYTDMLIFDVIANRGTQTVQGKKRKKVDNETQVQQSQIRRQLKPYQVKKVYQINLFLKQYREKISVSFNQIPRISNNFIEGKQKLSQAQSDALNIFTQILKQGKNKNKKGQRGSDKSNFSSFLSKVSQNINQNENNQQNTFKAPITENPNQNYEITHRSRKKTKNKTIQHKKRKIIKEISEEKYNRHPKAAQSTNICTPQTQAAAKININIVQKNLNDQKINNNISKSNQKIYHNYSKSSFYQNLSRKNVSQSQNQFQNSRQASLQKNESLWAQDYLNMGKDVILRKRFQHSQKKSMTYFQKREKTESDTQKDKKQILKKKQIRKSLNIDYDQNKLKQLFEKFQFDVSKHKKNSKRNNFNGLFASIKRCIPSHSSFLMNNNGIDSIMKQFLQNKQHLDIRRWSQSKSKNMLQMLHPIKQDLKVHLKQYQNRQVKKIPFSNYKNCIKSLSHVFSIANKVIQKDDNLPNLIVPLLQHFKLQYGVLKQNQLYSRMISFLGQIYLHRKQFNLFDAFIFFLGLDSSDSSYQNGQEVINGQQFENLSMFVSVKDLHLFLKLVNGLSIRLNNHFDLQEFKTNKKVIEDNLKEILLDAKISQKVAQKIYEQLNSSIDIMFKTHKVKHNYDINLDVFKCSKNIVKLLILHKKQIFDSYDFIVNSFIDNKDSQNQVLKSVIDSKNINNQQLVSIKFVEFLIDIQFNEQYKKLSKKYQLVHSCQIQDSNKISMQQLPSILFQFQLPQFSNLYYSAINKFKLKDSDFCKLNINQIVFQKISKMRGDFVGQKKMMELCLEKNNKLNGFICQKIKRLIFLKIYQKDVTSVLQNVLGQEMTLFYCFGVFSLSKDAEKQKQK